MSKEICLCTKDCELGFNPNCICKCKECNCKDIENIIGKTKKEVFHTIVDNITKTYETNQKWTRVVVKTKKWNYEYKISKGKKTICGFYITNDCLGFMIIFGKKEQERFIKEIASFSNEVQKVYNETKTYYDGKWMMFELEDLTLVDDIKKLLEIKQN